MARSTATSNPDVSIIVPTYREAENLHPLVKGVCEVLRSSPYTMEMIIVDDCSNDGSAEIVRELAEEYPVRMIVRRDARDLSGAVVRGFQEARGQFLVCMDADLSHPPESIPGIVRPIAEGLADFSIGSRYVAGGSTIGGWGLLRWVNSKAATLLARPLTPAHDPMAGFFCLSRESFEKSAPLRPVGYKIGLELMVKAHCRRICEVPITFKDRTANSSKLDLRQRWLYLVHLRRLYVYRWPVAARILPILLLLILIGAGFGLARVAG